MRPTTRLLALIALMLCAANLTADQPGHVVASTTPRGPELTLPLSGDAFLRQMVSADLSAGMNTLAFPFGRLEVPIERLQVSVATPPTGVRMVDVRFAPDARDTVLWDLEAESAGEAVFALAYPLKGIEWRCEYVGSLDQAERSLALRGRVSFTNRSKIEFDSVLVGLPGGHTVATKLKQNETFQMDFLPESKLPYTSSLIFDAAKYGGSVMAVLKLARDDETCFSAMAVPGGRLRIFAPGKGGMLLGEDTLPYLPPREEAEVRLGPVPEITVARKVLSSTKVDEKTDIRNKLVLFHQDDEVELEIKNQRPDPVSLIVRDRISDDWRMMKHSAPYVKANADTIAFSVDLEGGAATKITYTARRHNLQP